jgi:hypothetical protein
LQAEFREDAINAAFADLEAGLPKFLGNDLARSVWIEETVPNGLANDFHAAAVVAFGSSLLAEERRRAFCEIGVAKLEVALAAKAMSAGGHDAGACATLTFDQHGQFANDLVIGGHG